MTRTLRSRRRCLLWRVLCIPIGLSAGVALLLGCGANDKAKKDLEASRTDVLSQVRHLRMLNGANVTVGDLITGSYKECKKGSVKYVASTDWIGTGNRGFRVGAVVAEGLRKDGWAPQRSDDPRASLFVKGDFTVALVENASHTIEEGHVAGKCYAVDDSADEFIGKPVDEYSK
jgi:hypothetical protein